MPMRNTPEIRLVRAPNASTLTGSGTNTYVLGRGCVAVIDPGPDMDMHLAAILGTLGPGESISHILVTHPHLDHSALAPRLAAATGAPVYGFGPAHAGRSAVMQQLSRAGLSDGGEGLDRGFQPDVLLAGGDGLSAPSWEVTALHTPGHLGAHLCFAAGAVLFSGDHVMGWSSSIVAPPDGDMTDYMASLDLLAETPWQRLLPGHGDAVDDPAARIATLLHHRREREAQILSALADGPADAATLAAWLYTDIPRPLMRAAQANVLAHLIDLTQKQRTATPAPLTVANQFHLT